MSSIAGFKLENRRIVAALTWHNRWACGWVAKPSARLIQSLQMRPDEESLQASGGWL